MKTYSANMKILIFFLLVMTAPAIIAGDNKNKQPNALEIPLLKSASGAQFSGPADEETGTLEQDSDKPRKNCCTKLANCYQSWDAKKCRACMAFTSILVVVGGTAAMAALVRRNHTKN